MSRDAWEPMWVMLRNVAERHRPGHGQLVRQMRVERRNDDAVIVTPPLEDGLRSRLGRALSEHDWPVRIEEVRA